MQRRTIALLVGLGGAAGAVARWAVADQVEPSASFPVATFVVNIAGCLLLGLVFDRAGQSIQAAVGTGFCGGLTTFSTFAVEVVDLAERDDLGIAIAYLVASVVLGIAAVHAGRRFVGHRS